MDFKDGGLSTVIENNEQFVDTYPELFKKISMGNVPVYLEQRNVEEGFKPEERVFLLPSGMLSVSTLDLDYLWKVSENDMELIEELNRYAATESAKKRDKEGEIGFNKVVINNTEYGIRYFPYMDSGSNGELLEILSKR
ncbi:MAG: hypothetical protein AB9915_00040 [Candidatus Dojkabacteria bacterium]